MVAMPEDQASWITEAAWFLSPDRDRGPADQEATPSCWVNLAARLAGEDLEYLGCEHLEYQEDGKLWIGGMESFNPEYVAILLHEWMLAFDIKDRAVSFQYAETCSKPRCDEFGGGAVVVSHSGIEFLHTATWVEQTINELTESQGA